MSSDLDKKSSFRSNSQATQGIQKFLLLCFLGLIIESYYRGSIIFMKKISKPGYFPILVDLSKFSCLVIGGGNVAYRKVLSLREFNADITIISPRFCKALIELAKNNKIKIIKKSYSIEYLKGFKVVFCTTNNKEINQTVYKDCRKEGIFVNVADAPELCDFIMPANIKRGDLTISISSQGKAPFFVKEMKKKLQFIITPGYSEIINLAAKFRHQVISIVKPKHKAARTKMFKEFTAVNWEKYLEEHGKKNSQRQVQKILNELN